MKIVLLLIILALSTTGQAQDITVMTTGHNASFRGLATYKEHAIWVCGSNGTVGKSLNAGKTWSWINPPGYEHYDFRDIELFSAKEAVILSAGSPAVILKTIDGGKTWKEIIRDDREEIFMDGMDFDGAHGFAFGDPIEGRFQLWETKDKGNTWTDVTDFMFLIADEEEAGFAASGTSIKVIKGVVWIGTGGKYASIFRRDEKALTMDKMDVPIAHGEASTGIFSIDFSNTQTGIAVGGNYTKDNDNSNNIMLTYDSGQTWEKPQSPLGGYRSCVQYVNKTTLLATGTSGTDISTDAGKNWKTISKSSYNVLAKSASGKVVYFAGSDGNIAKLTFAH